MIMIIMQISKKSVKRFSWHSGFFVEGYQEDMYEKFQVNSTSGLAGRAFPSSHPML